jgi:hypothetical protein
MPVPCNMTSHGALSAPGGVTCFDGCQVCTIRTKHVDVSNYDASETWQDSETITPSDMHFGIPRANESIYLPHHTM